MPLALPAGDRALAISRHEGFRALYEIDLNTMEFVRKVYGVDGYDIDDVDLNAGADRGRRHRRDRGPARASTGWIRACARSSRRSTRRSAPATRTIVSTDRPRDEHRRPCRRRRTRPAPIISTTPRAASIRHIGWVNTTLRDMRLNPVRTIRYRASDGREIAAVLTLPRLRERRNLPLIVLPHGGPWARDAEGWDIWAQPLAELGYAVIQPNYRGSSGYGKDWEAASDGNWGTRMQDDLNDAVDPSRRARASPMPARVCMFGWSYGGYAASRAAQRDGDRYRCAISGAGVHDIPDMVAYDRDYLGRYGSQYIGSAAARLADVSPVAPYRRNARRRS